MKNKKDIKEIIINAVLFILLILMSAYVIVSHVSRVPLNVFWKDTTFSINLIRLPLSELIKTTAVHDHPPFYFIFAKTLVHFLGDMPWVYRFSAYLPFVLIVLTSVIFIRKIFGYLPAFIVVSFAGFMPSSIYFIVETRMYELGCFLMLAVFLLLYALMRIDGKKLSGIICWALFYLFSIAAAYTHYYMTVGIGVLYLMLIVYFVKNKKDVLNCFIVSFLALISYLPWIGVFLKDASERKEDWWVSEYSGFDEILKEVFGYRPVYITAVCITVFMIVFRFIMHKRSADQTKEKSLSDNKYLLMGTALFLAPASFGILVSVLIRPYVISRYLYPYSAVCWLVFGISLRDLLDMLLNNMIKSDKLSFLKSLISGLCAVIISVTVIRAGTGEYWENVSYQVEASAKTDYFILSTPIPEGSIVYSEIEYEDSGIVKAYFPQTQTINENALFYYTVPEYDEFYLFWMDDHVEETCTNLEKYGYECVIMSTGGTLGVQENISVVYCKKN